MIRLLALLAALLTPPAQAQQVQVIGPITPGHCAVFFSTTQIADGQATSCGLGGGGGGFGSMASQNANNVAITGGFITGMPLPAAVSDVATKGYVDNATIGFVVHPASRLATTAALPTNVYNNGTAGVGATMTASAVGALTVDGVAVAGSDRIVVKNEAAAANNGIYTVTAPGNAGSQWVLTRATDANTPGSGDPNKLGFGTYSFINAGTVNANSGWQVNSAVSTIGTSAVNWVQFNGGVSGVTSQVNTAGTGLVTSGNCNNTSTNAPSPCQYAIAPARLQLPTTSLVTTTSHTGGFGANGSGTYTTPANTLWLEIRFLGGGGGGGGGNNATAATNGGDTCWNTSGAACTTPVYLVGGGVGGSNAGTGAAGGTVSGTGTCTWAQPGGAGGVGKVLASANETSATGANGGGSQLGGGGIGQRGSANPGLAGVANTGGGGGGGGVITTVGNITGGGGGAGAYCSVIINTPAASYTYVVGAGGAGRAAGSNAGAGGAGAGGQIFIIEHYGS